MFEAGGGDGAAHGEGAAAGAVVRVNALGVDAVFLEKGEGGAEEGDGAERAVSSGRSLGSALEVFAEAWLTTQRIPQAREVWPGSSAPPLLQAKLRLPLNDMGVDGVFEAVAGEPICYQVKFRIGRPQLTWCERSTFFGLADTGCGRLVFTNCDQIASVAQERPGVVFVRGSDLDRLTADDFRVVEAWLNGAAVTRPRKKPKPHQTAAIDDICSARRE